MTNRSIAFLVEQLAGDLLEGANQETKTATGFLMLGAQSPCRTGSR